MEPCRTIRPRSTMATASHVRSTSSRRCDDNTTVRPSATRERIMSRISRIPAGSSPFIGSSRIKRWGSPSRQAATPSRWRMPIENFDTRSSARCSDAHPLERRADAAAGRPLTGGRQDLQVLPPGQMTVEPRLVDDGPDPGQRPIAVSRDRVAEEGHRSGVGPGEPEQDPDEGGLAGAVGPEVAEGASPGHQQLHVVDSDVVPEPFGQSVGLDRPVAPAGPTVAEDRGHGRRHEVPPTGASALTTSSGAGWARRPPMCDRHVRSPSPTGRGDRVASPAGIDDGRGPRRHLANLRFARTGEHPASRSPRAGDSPRPSGRGHWGSMAVRAQGSMDESPPASDRFGRARPVSGSGPVLRPRPDWPAGRSAGVPGSDSQSLGRSRWDRPSRRPSPACGAG